MKMIFETDLKEERELARGTSPWGHWKQYSKQRKGADAGVRNFSGV